MQVKVTFIVATLAIFALLGEYFGSQLEYTKRRKSIRKVKDSNLDNKTGKLKRPFLNEILQKGLGRRYDEEAETDPGLDNNFNNDYNPNYDIELEIIIVEEWKEKKASRGVNEEEKKGLEEPRGEYEQQMEYTDDVEEKKTLNAQSNEFDSEIARNESIEIPKLKSEEKNEKREVFIIKNRDDGELLTDTEEMNGCHAVRNCHWITLPEGGKALDCREEIICEV